MVRCCNYRHLQSGLNWTHVYGVIYQRMYSWHDICIHQESLYVQVHTFIKNETSASFKADPSSHTVPHSLLWYTSTLSLFFVGSSIRQTVIKLMINIFALHLLIKYVYDTQVHSCLLIKVLCGWDCALNTAAAINVSLENTTSILLKFFPTSYWFNCIKEN